MNIPLKKYISDHFSKLSPNPELSFSNIPRNQNQYLTHSYHRYPAKFIPGLASYLINTNTKKNDVVCDPFGGCGTTLVEAKINSRHSVGIDINPLASLISKTKITAISPRKLQNYTDDLLERIKNSKSTGKDREVNPRIKYWFDDQVLEGLLLIDNVIKKTADIEIKRFFQCAFSHILKNCSRWLMKSIKPTIDKKKIPPIPQKIFNQHLKFMIRKNYEFYEIISRKKLENISAKFYLRDARNTKLPKHFADYILTSPPYVTSYEYSELHQLGILWFNMTNDWKAFKKKFIGTTYRTDKNKGTNSEIASNIIQNMIYYGKDIGLAKSISTYYEDMWDFILESKRILKTSKKISLVLGNTSIKGVEILNAEVAYEQLLKAGFKNLEVEKRQTSSQSITPFRDIESGRFTSIANPNKRRAYQYEYIITGIN